MVGARYYDVTCGRFISRDTNLSQLPYAYCAGDPVNLVDPGGHSYVPTFKQLCSLAVPGRQYAATTYLGNGLFNAGASLYFISTPDPGVIGDVFGSGTGVGCIWSGVGLAGYAGGGLAGGVVVGGGAAIAVIGVIAAGVGGYRLGDHFAHSGWGRGVSNWLGGWMYRFGMY